MRIPAVFSLAAALWVCVGCAESPVEPDWGFTATEIPPAATRIPIRVTRFAPGSGMVIVSNAIPLQAGMLRRSDLQNFRIVIGDKEPELYVEALEGEHADGSLRSVFVQFLVPATDTGFLEGDFVPNVRREHPDRAKLTDNRSLPQAVVLPTNPTYLVSTGIVGPTITAEESREQGIPYVKYEDDFATYADRHWATEGEDGCNNYYDRALSYFAFWARTGNPEYWRRGARCAVMYRKLYLEPNNYGSSPHWSQLEGLEAHYTLTGDDSSRVAIERVEKVLRYWYSHFNPIPETSSVEDRIRARALISMLMAWRINAGGQKATYEALLDSAITRIAASQGTDGSYRFPSLCDESMNYMTGLLNDALIKIYHDYKQDPLIPQIVQRSADFLWDTQWVADRQSFQYLSGNCDGIGTTNPGIDLNGLFVNTFSFTYAQTRDVTYRDRADAVFVGSMASTGLSGSKQFNQQYYSSYLHLKSRQ